MQDCVFSRQLAAGSWRLRSEVKLHLLECLLRKITLVPTAGICEAKSNCICWVVYCENLRLHWYLSAAPYELFSFHYQNLLFREFHFPNLPFLEIPITKVCIKSVKMIKAACPANPSFISRSASCANLHPHRYLPAAPYELFSFHYQNLPFSRIPFPESAVFVDSNYKSLYQISENDKRRRGLRIRASSLILPLAQTCARATTCPRTANPNCISQPASCANLRPHRYPPPHRHLSTRKKAAAPRKKWSSGP